MITRIVLDENLSPAGANALKAFLDIDQKRPVDVLHLVRDLKSGSVADDVWMARLKPAIATLVVTSDRGRQQDGAKLPEVARSLGIPTLTLFRSLGKRPMLDRIRAILVMWPDIQSVILPTQKAAHWRLICVGARGYRLTEVTPPPPQTVFYFARPRERPMRGDKKNHRG